MLIVRRAGGLLGTGKIMDFKLNFGIHRVAFGLALGASACAGVTQTSPDSSAGPPPLVELPLVEVGPQVQANKLDVLFVIDNSESMDDKSAVLVQSLPAFVAQLVNPPCVDSNGVLVDPQPASGSDPCAAGARARPAVTDMHLGVITSSLGGHGGSVCSEPAAGAVDPHLDDQAELIPSKRSGVPSYLGSGFASWDVTGQAGDTNAAAVSSQVQAMISAAGHTGCGFEAPLEAMYRFLIDPEPPVSVERIGNDSVSSGVNQDLLAQRAAFLRPDSAVAVVLLSDENDCSIVDSGVAWFVGASSHMPMATAACAADPNDHCCRSCAQNEEHPPSGCAPLTQDPVCMGAAAGSYQTWDNLHDSLNLRCFDQKRRFGFDLLNPVWRYSVGLTNPQVYNQAGKLVPNPLFAQRSPSLVSVSMLVGAPWQDLASDDSLSSDGLSVLSAAQLENEQRWPLLVGDLQNNVAPSDPLMIESIEPRAGLSPVTGVALAPADSSDPLANPSNGHEKNNPDRADLQYACIFQLPTPRDCAAKNSDQSCRCSPSNTGDTSAVTTENSPDCQPPTGGPPSTTQYFAEAYPGTRELLVAHALADRAVSASICPKQASGEGASSGYLPALSALAQRIGATLQ
jgi:hypothetical protein